MLKTGVMTVIIDWADELTKGSTQTARLRHWRWSRAVTHSGNGCLTLTHFLLSYRVYMLLTSLGVCYLCSYPQLLPGFCDSFFSSEMFPQSVVVLFYKTQGIFWFDLFDLVQWNNCEWKWLGMEVPKSVYMRLSSVCIISIVWEHSRSPLQQYSNHSSLASLSIWQPVQWERARLRHWGWRWSRAVTHSGNGW